MALTYRSDKGTPLTTDELDNNFRHFTGSHAVTGSFKVSGSLVVSGSISSTELITLLPLDLLPTSSANGSIAFYDNSFYFRSGSIWYTPTLS